MLKSWVSHRKEWLEIIERRTPDEEIIGMNSIVITAAVSKAPKAMFRNENEYYWIFELWEPNREYPISWKIIFPSGLYDEDMISMTEGSWVIVHGYVCSYFEKEIEMKGGKGTKLILTVNGNDLHVLRTKKTKHEKK